MNKKNNIIIMIVAVIVLAVIIILVLKNGYQRNGPDPLSQSDIEINQAIKSDTTKAITEKLNNINVDDTLEIELLSVDQELKKL